MTKEQALAAFRTNWTQGARNWHEAKRLIESQIEKARATTYEEAQEPENTVSVAGAENVFTKGLDWEKYQRGRLYWLHGLMEESQRHDAVLCIGHYLWYGDLAAGVKALPFLKNAGARAEKIRHWFREKKAQ